MKSKLQARLGMWRWEALLLVLLIAVGWAVKEAAIPMIGKLTIGLENVKRESAFIGKADSFGQELRNVKSDARMIDSLMTASHASRPFAEAVMLGTVYHLADSVGCTTGKLLIGDSVVIEGGKEVPVSYEGRGSYRALGKVIDGIENLEYSTRIRQIDMKRLDSDSGSMSVDFVVLGGN